MIEAGVSLAVAGITGACVLVSRLHGRIHQLDQRLDQTELRVAEKYVPREELLSALTRFEGHIVRIEGKLDTLKDNIIIRQQ